MQINIPENTRLLMVCPSRIRPDRILEMLESYDATKSPGTELIIYVADDDPRLEEYKMALHDRNWIVGPRRHTPHVYNYIACELYPNIPYYGMADDDHYYLTKGWDLRFIEAIEKGGGWGLACGLDNLTNWETHQHPCGCIIDGKVIRTLGYMVYPKFIHIGIDMAQGAFFGKLGRLYRLTDVTIEHRHIWNKKAKRDANYDWVYSQENMDYGLKTYGDWRASEFPRSVALIQEAMEAEHKLLGER